MQVQLKEASAEPGSANVIVLDPSGHLDPGTAATLPQPLRDALACRADWAAGQNATQVHVATESGTWSLTMLRPSEPGPQSLLGIEIEPNGPNYQGDAAKTERERSQSRDIRRGVITV